MIDEEYELLLVGIDETQECDFVSDDSAGRSEEVKTTAWTYCSLFLGTECLGNITQQCRLDSCTQIQILLISNLFYLTLGDFVCEWLAPSPPN